MTLWRFQQRLTWLLLGWAAAGIGVGVALGRGGDPLRRGVGEQYVGWGVVNAMIAVIGRRGAMRQRSAAPDDLAARKRTLSRLLWLNTGLDVLYVLGGRRLMRGRGATIPFGAAAAWALCCKAASCSSSTCSTPWPCGG